MEKQKRRLSLPAWIFIGMVAGILAGLAFLKAPDFTTEWIKPIGTIYINLLKFNRYTYRSAPSPQASSP